MSTRGAGNAYDTVVIGADLNGLVAAAYLARAGQRVLVLDERSVAGGAAVTEEFAPGFRCDTAQGDAGWISPRIVAELGLVARGLRLVSPGSRMLVPAGDTAWLGMHNTPAQTAAALSRYSASDAQRWPRFAERIATMAGFLQQVYAADAPNVEATSIGDYLRLLRTGLQFRRMGTTAMVDLLRTAPMSVGELLDDEFGCEALKGAVAAEGIRHLMQGPRSGGTSFVLLHHQVGRSAGTLWPEQVPEGGVGALATALVGAVRAMGGEVRMSSAVARIRMHEGRATGVVLASGDEIGAAQVVSSADPRTTFFTLADPTQLAPEFVRAVRNIRYNGVWAKVNLALDTLPTFAGITADDLRDATLLRLTTGVTHLERAYDDAKYGRVAADPWLDVRLPSLTQPGCAPAGKHVMSVHVQFVPYHRRSGGVAPATDPGAPTPWDDAARLDLGDLVVQSLERYAPGLGGLIRARQVLTPLDLEQRFALPEGNAYHGEMTLDQVLFMRPVPECSRYTTPVRNLFLCGSGSHPGGGIAGAAGANAARHMLRSNTTGR